MRNSTQRTHLDFRPRYYSMPFQENQVLFSRNFTNLSIFCPLKHDFYLKNRLLHITCQSCHSAQFCSMVIVHIAECFKIELRRNKSYRNSWQVMLEYQHPQFFCRNPSEWLSLYEKALNFVRSFNITVCVPACRLCSCCFNGRSFYRKHRSSRRHPSS